MEFYNRERVHQGYRTQGPTTHHAFLEGVNAIPEAEYPARLPGSNSLPDPQEDLLPKEVIA